MIATEEKNKAESTLWEVEKSLDTYKDELSEVIFFYRHSLFLQSRFALIQIYGQERSPS